MHWPNNHKTITTNQTIKECNCNSKSGAINTLNLKVKKRYYDYWSINIYDTK